MSVYTENPDVGLKSQLAAYSADIKLAHSVFALPFLFSALLFMWPFEWSLSDSVFLILAMVSARSFAMGINRLVDASIDARNPRTAGRAIPAGRLSKRPAAWIAFFNAIVLIACSFSLSSLAGLLSPLLLAILAGYSFIKRIGVFCHLYLGCCLGLVPIAGAIALEMPVGTELYYMAWAIALWTTGFDILYALQDMDFDRKQGLHSVPAAFGVKNSIWISRVLFMAMVALLWFVGVDRELSVIYFIGVGLVGLFLAYEHWLVRDSEEGRLSAKIGGAFFNVNASVSVLYFATVLAEMWFNGRFGL